MYLTETCAPGDCTSNSDKQLGILRLPMNHFNFARQFTLESYEVLEPGDIEGWLTARFHLESVEMAAMLVFGLGVNAQIIEPIELA